MTVSEYQVTGMTCGHCEAAVRSEVEQIPGVSELSVSARSGRLVVRSEQALDETAVLAAVDEAGYSAARLS